jgi:hypothetical protein
MGDLHAILVRHIRRHLTWVSATPFVDDKTGVLRNGLANTLFSLHLHMRIVSVVWCSLFVSVVVCVCCFFNFIFSHQSHIYFYLCMK